MSNEIGILSSDQKLINVRVTSSGHTLPLLDFDAILFLLHEYTMVINYKVAYHIFGGPRLPPLKILGPPKIVGTRAFNFMFTLQKSRVPLSQKWVQCVPFQK